MKIQVKIFQGGTSEENFVSCNKFIKGLKKGFNNHKTFLKQGNTIHIVTYFTKA